MRKHYSWLAWPAMLLLVVAAAVARERGQGATAQSDGNRPEIVIEEIVEATLAPGEPTPDYTLLPEASLDVEGAPALAPRTGDGPPDFTVAEIEAYLAKTPHRYAEGTPEIVEIDVMTAIEAAYEVDTPIYRPQDAPVLVVDFRGQFYVSGPPGRVLSGQSSHMVFDARTGNLLTITVGE